MKKNLNEIKNISTLKAFCRYFALSEQSLEHLRKNKEELVKAVVIPKRNGNRRIVFLVGDDTYRNFLKAVAELLTAHYMLRAPQSVHGFVKKKSIITNAKCHLQKKVLLNLDIKNFFESIHDDKLLLVFKEVGFNGKHASILTDLVTIRGILATGFPTSPVLANIICVEMDLVFEKLCSKYEAVYTRYADDISISSNNSLPPKKIISDVLSEYRFAVNKDKYKISWRGGSQYVTGLTVCDEKPRLPRKTKRAIRQEMYYIKKYGFMNHVLHLKEGILTRDFTRRRFIGYGFHGYIAYIHSIEPELAKKIWKQFKMNRGNEERNDEGAIMIGE